MAETNRFVYVKKKETFTSENEAKYSESIVFIEDTKEIFTHGQYFSGVNFGDSYDIVSEDSSLKTSFKTQITDSATTAVSIGSIPAGTSITEFKNKSYQEIFEKILFKELDAVKGSGPTATLVVNPSSSSVKIGTTVTTKLTLTYKNAYWINGGSTTADTNYPIYSSTANFTINLKRGSNDSETALIKTTNSFVKSDFTFTAEEGSNTFSGTAEYSGSGLVGKSSYGNDSGTAVSTDTTNTITVSVTNPTITGYWPLVTNAEVGSSTNVANSSTVTSTSVSELNSNVATSNGTIYLKFGPEDGTQYVIKTPREISSILQRNEATGKFDIDFLSDFTKTSSQSYTISSTGRTNDNYYIYTHGLEKDTPGASGYMSLLITFKK